MGSKEPSMCSKKPSRCSKKPSRRSKKPSRMSKKLSHRQRGYNAGAMVEERGTIQTNGWENKVEAITTVMYSMARTKA